MIEAGLQVQDVSRALTLDKRTLPILRNISFVVRQGEWVALTGPSGSGKSTLLGILGGIDRPTAGHVLLDGVEMTALPEQRLARLRNEKIGVVFQAFHLLPTMTARENVAAPLYIHPERRRATPLAIAMLERRYEIGVLKTFGYTRGHVLGALVFEYTLLAVITSLAGLAFVQIALWMLGIANNLAARLLSMDLRDAVVICGVVVELTLLTVLAVV